MRFDRIVLLAVLATTSTAQADDPALWTRGRVANRFERNFMLEGALELRLNELADDFDRVFLEVAARYRFSPHFQGRGFYRFSLLDSGDGTDDAHRFGADATYRFHRRPRPTKVVFRSRLQSEEGVEYWRNRVKLAYRIHRAVIPYVASDVWFRLGDDVNDFRRLWLEAGAVWKTSRRYEIETFWIYERELGVDTSFGRHIVGLGLTALY
jgi:hypothetical protein